MTEVNLFEVLEPDENFTATGRAKGQGRKGKVVEQAVLDAIAAEGAVPLQVARAKKEGFEAKLKELQYRERLGELVERERVREVCATAMAAFVQATRSIGDILERKYGVDPEICQVVNNVHDAELASLAETFKLLGGE